MALHQRLAAEPMAWPVYGSMLADVRRVTYEISREIKVVLAEPQLA